MYAGRIVLGRALRAPVHFGASCCVDWHNSNERCERIQAAERGWGCLGSSFIPLRSKLRVCVVLCIVLVPYLFRVGSLDFSSNPLLSFLPLVLPFSSSSSYSSYSPSSDYTPLLPPQLSFDWEPLPAFYFIVFLLPPSASPPEVLFRLGPSSGPLLL